MKDINIVVHLYSTHPDYDEMDLTWCQKNARINEVLGRILLKSVGAFLNHNYDVESLTDERPWLSEFTIDDDHILRIIVSRELDPIKDTDFGRLCQSNWKHGLYVSRVMINDIQMDTMLDMIDFLDYLAAHDGEVGDDFNIEDFQWCKRIEEEECAALNRV